MTYRWIPTFLILVGAVIADPFVHSARAEAPGMVEGTVQGRSIRGLQLLGAINRHVVLGVDGQLFQYDPRHDAHQLIPIEGAFRPLGASDLQVQLQTEFGSSMEVVPTAHFLVVQPRDIGRNWPDRFELLHRTFLNYFRVRGIQPKQGNFPMVAVVHPNRETFLQQTREVRGMRELAQGGRQSSVRAFYDRLSNRVMMYDLGSESGMDATICHEAAHQSAFNVGVHSRVTETPHWVVEGIGCVFQAPDLIEGRRSGRLDGRCDPRLLDAFRATYGNDARRLDEDLSQLLASDEMFQQAGRVQNAYLASWALTFYLAERRASALSQLLTTYATRTPFRHYETSERNDEFVRAVPEDSRELARRVIRFLADF